MSTLSTEALRKSHVLTLLYYQGFNHLSLRHNQRFMDLSLVLSYQPQSYADIVTLWRHEAFSDHRRRQLLLFQYNGMIVLHGQFKDTVQLVFLICTVH